jgi:hypothetical protein
MTFHVTLLSLCANGIVGRQLSACIYGSARTGKMAPRLANVIGCSTGSVCFRSGEDRVKVILVCPKQAKGESIFIEGAFNHRSYNFANFAPPKN